jgi:hypothetical protein
MWRRFGGALVVGSLVLFGLGVSPAAAAPSNDGVVGALEVTDLYRVPAFDIATATADGDDAAVDMPCGYGPTTQSVWFSYTPTFAHRLAGWAKAFDRNTRVWVPLEVAVMTGESGSLQRLTCEFSPHDSLAVTAGTRYLIRVSLDTRVLTAPSYSWLALRDYSCSGAPASLDEDGCPDLAVGLPGATVDGAGGAGAVEVNYGNGFRLLDKRRQRLEPGSALGVPVQPRSGFGQVLAQGRLDGDGFDDLVIGIPRLDVGDAVDAGAVLVLFGGPGGVGDRRLLLRQGDLPGTGRAESGDRFGTSLAIGGGGVLAVGVPGEDVGSVPIVDAGAVVTYSGFTTSGDDPTARLLSQAGPLAGTPEAGDQFGAALAFGPGSLLVGVPGEDVGSVVDAGAVVKVSRSGATAGFTQNSPGMGGVAETGDRFGAAISYLPFYGDEYRMAIGAPGEDLGRIRDAGMINFLEARTATSTLQPMGQVLTQDSPYVGGVAERGDRFGSVLSSPGWGLVVGVAEEDLGALVDAGAVWVLGPRPDNRPGAGRLAGGARTQDSPGFAETAEAGDRFGASMTFLAGDPKDDGRGGGMYVGAPGEDLGGVADAGFVQGPRAVLPGTREPGQRFGAALPSG